VQRRLENVEILYHASKDVLQIMPDGLYMIGCELEQHKSKKCSVFSTGDETNF